MKWEVTRERLGQQDAELPYIRCAGYGDTKHLLGCLKGLFTHAGSSQVGTFTDDGAPQVK